MCLKERVGEEDPVCIRWRLEKTETTEYRRTAAVLAAGPLADTPARQLKCRLNDVRPQYPLPRTGRAQTVGVVRVAVGGAGGVAVVVVVVVVALFGTRAGLLLRVLFFLTQRGLLDSSACLKELPLSAWKAGDGVTLSSSFFLVFFWRGEWRVGGGG